MRSGEKRLSPVKNDLHFRKLVLENMVGYSTCRAVRYLVAHEARLLLPRLVGQVIDVAVVTVQITTRGNFEQERIKRPAKKLPNYTPGGNQKS